MYNALFESLASDASRNFKLDLLKQHKDNDVLKQIINLALNPFVQFYIRKIPAYTRDDNKPALALGYALQQLSLLSSRDVTGNTAIEFLTRLLSELESDDAKVIERVIQKDLKCGVSEATVNAVWPGLIPEYPCMLASAYDQKLIDKVKFPAYCQLKLDGMRFNAIVRNGSVEFRSRNGKEINIADPLFALPFIHMAGFYGCDMVFDGELLVVDEAGKTLDRKTGNGILNKAVKGTQSAKEGSMVRATLWDAIVLERFEQGVDNEPYRNRLAKLSNCLSDLKNRSALGHLVDLVPHKEVNSLHEARVQFEKYLAEGQEGIILKCSDMIWENKRSKKQIKFKAELECDLLCVGWEEGTGRNKGKMGALVLRSADGAVETNVGTGFSDEDRIRLTESETVGKIITVKYNGRITDKRSSVDSLFLPVYLEVREDKTEANSSSEIK